MRNMCPLLLHLTSPGDEASRDILLEVMTSHSSSGFASSAQCKGAMSIQGIYPQGSTALEGRHAAGSTEIAKPTTGGIIFIDNSRVKQGWYVPGEQWW